VTTTVENTSPFAGREVVQVYVSKPDSRIDRPLQELKASILLPATAEQNSLNADFIDFAHYKNTLWQPAPPKRIFRTACSKLSFAAEGGGILFTLRKPYSLKHPLSPLSGLIAKNYFL